ncbi:hypothetical protein [Azospirillum sp.]|uniref:hypothetical protein n=1 Tax=Azospirillum sp. TaxID=34012 RepID=UPI003D74D1E2
MSTVNPADEARTFPQLLATLEDGELSNDLTDQIRDIVARLHDVYANQGGTPKASLTLKIDFKLDSGVIETKADTKVALPKQVRRKTVLYATPGNNLTRQNPKQAELFPRPVRDVSAPAESGVRAV